MRRVVVANPGGQSHFKDHAATLAAHGWLERYISTFGFGPDDVARAGRLPGRLGQRAQLELKRRGVNEEVGDRSTRVATALELANVLLTRAPLPMRAKYGAFKTTREHFDAKAAALLTSQTDAVLGYQGATTTTFRRARQLGIKTVLDYPIAHYEFTERTLEEEARLVPEYAPTLRVQRYPEWIKRRYVEEINTADRIIMVSEHHTKTFVDAGVDPKRTFIVPWYIDTELFSPAPNRTATDDIFRIAFLGQITQRKGISYLVEGFKRASLQDAELVLIGAPIGDVRPWASVPGIRHIPPMARFLLPEQLRRCHVIALPSLVEGFPISALEGMACGLPALISENLGHDIVQDGIDGFVVPIRDPDAIAERLRELHADTARRVKMAEAARAKAAGFTLEHYRGCLINGLETMLAQREADQVRAA
ncbi:MAG TPA: glycosyltransferase [Solirubrobacteraceae bacterium]|nr:glycosyltransferase [Solirubrobacteraceae bacterium]